jgi:BirA family biotin operon repressor/biotin-[acetyl-CoA-carboxylase] ligase
MSEDGHQDWGAEAIWRRLQPLLPGISVEVMARVESTNTRLLDRARALGGQRDAPVTRPGQLDARPGDERTPHGRRSGDVSPCLMVAEQQTRGRGRLGRDWVSSAGASLTFSISLPLAPEQWAGLSLAVGLALAEALDPQPLAAWALDPQPLAAWALDPQPQPAWALDPQPPAEWGLDPQPMSAPALGGGAVPRIGLKWPNDLWLMDGPGRGRKLGGVLIETVSVGQRRMCVVGVGLNVLPQPNENLTHGYACLQEIDPEASAPRALAVVVEPLVRALQRFETEGFAPRAGAYARRDLLRGLAVSTTPPEPVEGIAEGVDEQGALRVRSGAIHRVVSGEVSVRLRAGSE